MFPLGGGGGGTLLRPSLAVVVVAVTVVVVVDGCGFVLTGGDTVAGLVGVLVLIAGVEDDVAVVVVVLLLFEVSAAVVTTAEATVVVVAVVVAAAAVAGAEEEVLNPSECMRRENSFEARSTTPLVVLMLMAVSLPKLQERVTNCQTTANLSLRVYLIIGKCIQTQSLFFALHLLVYIQRPSHSVFHT